MLTIFCCAALASGQGSCVVGHESIGAADASAELLKSDTGTVWRAH